MNWVERLNRVPGRILPGGERFAIDVLHWAYSAGLPDNVPHRHTYFEICLVGSYGSGFFIVEGVPHELRPGTLFIARPGVVHQIVNTPSEVSARMELYWVSLQWEPGSGGDAELVFRAFADATHVVAVPDAGRRAATLWTVLRQVAGLVAADAAGGDVQIAALMASLLIALARDGAGSASTSDGTLITSEATSGTGGQTALARIAVRYIHDNLSRALPVDEVAAHVHLSPRHLTRLFVRFTGVAPAAYVAQARLDRARTLLLRTDDPIKQIAALVGYADIHHFSRAFSQRFGCPPGLYRQTKGAADRTPRGLNIQKPGALV